MSEKYFDDTHVIWHVCFIVFVLLSLFHHAVYASDEGLTQPVLPDVVCATLLPQTGNNQHRLQEAIDHCPAGQAVKLTSTSAQNNTFVSGPLVMKSHVTLWLDQGVILAASADPDLFDKGSHTCGTIDQKGSGCRPFIHFDHTDDSAIVGAGEINGQGGQRIQGTSLNWWQLARQAQSVSHAKQNNPRLIEADFSHHLIFYGIRLKDSPNFHLVLNHVQHAMIWGVIIDAPADARNTDGIDPAASSDITITHSFIRTGDDNIAIKAGNGKTSRISIINNYFYAGHGMSVGSETTAGVSNVTVRQLTLDGTTSGIRIKSDRSRGGLVEHIVYQDVCMRHNQYPVDISTHYDEHRQGQFIPWYRDIVLNNIYADHGDVIINGYDADHQTQITLNGVLLPQIRHWHISNTQITVGENGISPLLPAASAALPLKHAPSCDQAWLPFPEDTLKIN